MITNTYTDTHFSTHRSTQNILNVCIITSFGKQVRMKKHRTQAKGLVSNSSSDNIHQLKITELSNPEHLTTDTHTYTHARTHGNAAQSQIMSNADEKNAAGIESNCEKATEDHKGNFTQKKKNKREIQWLPKKTHPQSNAFL